jgi:uncharacterized protein (UPF0548 family)
LIVTTRNQMTPWRIGRGWSDAEIQAQLAALKDRAVSFTDAPFEPADVADGGTAAPAAEPTPDWTVERFQALLGYEPAGRPLPDGLFARARQAVRAYRFADPRITHGHFNPGTPLLGRDILVDVHALMLRFLVGLRVGAVLNRAGAEQARFGIRLDTLEGHLLHGSEWIQVLKDHRSGAVRLRIEVRWRPAPLPAWWIGLGFRLFGRQARTRWRRQAVRRLRALGESSWQTR